MNFFAHAQHCLDEPYIVAGVALPDWLTVVRPRVRCRSKHAVPYINADRPELQAIARGVVRHHQDDAWFHQTAAFAQLSLSFARKMRTDIGDCDGMRPSFVGHILVEMLLDAQLIAEDPAAIDSYYASVNKLDAKQITQCVSVMVDAPVDDLVRVVRRFNDERFLYDYLSDEGLCFRLNQVLSRVGLPLLPAKFAQLLPNARAAVGDRQLELLPSRLERGAE